MPTSLPESYFPVLLAWLFAILNATGVILTGAALGKRIRNKFKDMPYESGMAPIGSAKERFSVKFYMVAMLFILFDIEAVFLYPWAVVYRDLKWFGFVEMVIFIVLVLAGYFYIYKKGVMNWSHAEDIERQAAAGTLRKNPTLEKLDHAA